MRPQRWPPLWCWHTVLLCSVILVGGQRPQERPPRPAGWSLASSSSWAPTPEPGAAGDVEGSVAAMTFLQTGDAQRLARANCSRGIAARAAGAGPPPALRATLRAAPEALAHAANFLNMLFQTNDIREASVAEDIEWYQALVRSLAEGHPWVRRAVLALDAHPLAAKPRLMLQATKRDGEILLRDASAAAPSLGNLSWDNEWFNAFRSQRSPQLRKRVLSNDLRTMDTPKWQQGDSYVGEPGHVRWSPPFLECQDGRFVPTWIVTLSSAFYGLKPDLSPEFKGVVRVDIELRDVAIDQCSSGPGWFAGTHRCDLNSTQCVPQESRGFVLGRYLCRCKPGFYRAGGAASGAQAGTAVVDGESRLSCRPCRLGCATCEDDVPCLIQEDRALRAAVLSCQACCMLAVFLSMLVSYHFRRSKRIRASGVVLLETILFGSLLLYFPVFILYFKPSIFRCIVLRWVRMLGFAIVYGTITLKLYRVLKLFLSRTAQRVPYVSSERVLKMLGLILLLVLWFLAAWTIGMLENVDKNIPLVVRTQTARGLHFYICSHDHWDYMMVIAEMLFLFWGSFLCYATRAVPSAFHEPRYMGIALHNELMISATFHVVRFIMVPSLHPDWTLLLFFAHTHGTITMTLALLFIPKFLHTGSPLREEIAAEVYEDELDMRHSGSCLNSSIASAWSEHSLDPDDIREELKKLYVQLEMHKTRRMAANNPHVPKKRSSRRSLARSLTRRGTEPPEPAARRSSGGERVATLARRSSSARRLPNAASASLRMQDDGSLLRAAAPVKSHSSEVPTREPPAGPPTPGEPVLGMATVAATASESADSESLDAAPLVCKSASAHNLTGYRQPLVPHAAPLQKSLSDVAGAREEALIAASRAARDGWHVTWHPATSHGAPEDARKPQGPGAAESLLPTSSSPAEEDSSPLGDGKAQKRVTYGPTKSRSVDSSHLPGRVRVAVKRTPPPPPIRYQSLGHRPAAAGDSPERAEPPADPPAQAEETEGPAVEAADKDLGGTTPSVRQGQLVTAASIPAQVCPWELVQEEILSQKQKAAGASDSGTPSETAATAPSLKPSSQKTSIRGLGLALKAFNRSRAKSILKGKREGEGSLGKKGREGSSRREKTETSAVSPGAISQDLSGQSPSSEPPAQPLQGDTVSCQQNNNAGTAWESEGWRGRGTEGQWDGPALGSSDGDKVAEEPSALQRDGDAGGGLEPHLEGQEAPAASIGHPEGAEHPHETPVVASSRKAQICPWEVVEPGEDLPEATVRLMTPDKGVAGPGEGLGVAGGSISPRDHAEEEQPLVKPTADSLHPPTAGQLRTERPEAEVYPWGAPAGRGPLLRQEAVASRDDSGEIPAKVLEKGGSQPQPLSSRGSQSAERVPQRSWSADVVPAVAGKAGRVVGRQEKVCPGETQADSSIKLEICPWEESWGQGRGQGKGSHEDGLHHSREEPDVKKPPGKTPELLKVALEKAEGRRADICPWETGERTTRAEICPWDTEGAQPEHEGQVKSVTKSRGPMKEQDSRRSLQAGGQPWGTRSHEEPPAKPVPKSSELPEVTWKGSSSTRASVCPWEAAGADSDAEVCPWEKGTALSDAGKSDDGDISPVKNGISPQKAAPRVTGGKALSAGKRRDRRGSPSPGKSEEQPSTDNPPALPRTSSKQTGSIDSKKTAVCPWEVEGETLHRAEVCPWEEPAAPWEKQTLSQDMQGTSIGERKLGSGGLDDIKAKLAEMGGHQSEHRDTETSAKFTKKRLESSKTDSQSKESLKEEVCPWESPSTKQLSEQCPTESPALPKPTSKKSQSEESMKAEVCPWEAPEAEATARADICPWEVAAAPSDQQKAKQGHSGGPKGEKHITRQAALASPVRCPEKDSSKREAICPWESLDTEQPPEQPCPKSPALPKSTSKKSQSEESMKAEVCPWEAPEAEATARADICPWMVAAPPPSKEKPRLDKDALSTVSKSSKEPGDSSTGKKTSRDRESICPWETTDTEESPAKLPTKSPALPKSTSKKSQSEESMKAEVCPWEAPEAEATARADICPWEVAAAPPEKGSSPAKLSLPLEKASVPQPPEKGSREREAICPWESPGTAEPSLRSATGKEPSEKSGSAESRRSDICPWEAAEPSSSEQESLKAGVSPKGADGASPTGMGKSKPVAGGSAVSPAALLKESKGRLESQAEHKPLCRIPPSVQTQRGLSAGSLPWGVSTAPAPESSPHPSANVSEVCPWEAEGAPPASDERKTSEVCPWDVETADPTQASQQGRASESPHNGASRVSETQHDVCPWDHE